MAVGSKVTLAAPGDRVMAAVTGGGQATLAAVDESHLLCVPDRVGWPEAGGFPEAYSTAYDALFTRCGLAPGDRLLVTRAAGGRVGAVQLGAVAGATVVASVRDPRRRVKAAALGAHEVVSADDLAGHDPYDVVSELVGVASLSQALDALATGARVAVIEVGSGTRLEVELGLMQRRATIAGSTFPGRSSTERAAVSHAVRTHVVPLVAEGRVRVPVCATYPLAEVAAAYDRFAGGKKLGKVVLVTGDAWLPVTLCSRASETERDKSARRAPPRATRAHTHRKHTRRRGPFGPLLRCNSAQPVGAADIGACRSMGAATGPPASGR